MGNCATGTANVDARIVAPITIAKLQDLSFGEIAPSTSAGTVKLAPDGMISAIGVTAVVSSEHSVATFKITSYKGNDFTIALPQAITIAGPGDPMTVDSFESSITGLDLDAATINVGAQLRVGANQAVGTYSGVFDVTVNYQ